MKVSRFGMRRTRCSLGRQKLVQTKICVCSFGILVSFAAHPNFLFLLRLVGRLRLGTLRWSSRVQRSGLNCARTNPGDRFQMLIAASQRGGAHHQPLFTAHLIGRI